MAVVNWKRGRSGDFDAPGNWRGGVVPGAEDDVRIDAGQGGQITVTSSADESVNSLQIGRRTTLAIASGNFTDLDGTGTAANAGTIAVGDGAALTLSGDFVNHRGVIAVDGAETRTSLFIAQAGAVLGGGSVTLGGPEASWIQGVYGGVSAPTLTNAATIIGDGLIANLAIRNSGVIDARGPFALVVVPGNLPEAGGSTISNHGTLEAGDATNTGVLTFYSMTIDNAGVIEANGVGSSVDFFNTTIRGGALGQGGGVITMYSANILDGRAPMVTNLATIEIDNGLSLEGRIVNAGEIDVGTATRGGVLGVLANTTLSGGGRVILGSDQGGAVYSATGATLTNIDNTISGAGYFDADGPTYLTLINRSHGVIDADGTDANPLKNILGMGNTSIVNAGLLEATNAGQLILTRPVDNTGTIEAAGGTVWIYGAISGSGAVVIDEGTLAIEETSSLDVHFKGAVGTLTLGMSQSFDGTVTGFSKTGGETLHLTDISYVGSAQATFSGVKTGGTLTVSDGTHTAHIALQGNYLGTVFTTVRDLYGHVVVEASTAGRFLAAMAGLAGGSVEGGGGAAMHGRLGDMAAVSLARCSEA